MTRHEQAKVIEKGPSLELIKRMADWIEKDERKDGSWVVGLYGERGAGKTSLLLTLLGELEERDGDAHRLALPTKIGVKRAEFPNLLKPAALRDHDALLFELLRHLFDRYEKRGNTGSGRDPFDKAREIEVQREDVERFLQYAEEVGASRKALEKENIKIRQNVASSTIRLKAEFDEIIKRLQYREDPNPQETPENKRTLVLLVDDIDLHPERALDLLEIFHIFLDQDGVVIVLAADKPLLLDGIERGLKKHRGLKEHPALAAALLAKYVPYEWHIPIPSESWRFDELWGRAELRRWWPSDEEAKEIPQIKKKNKTDESKTVEVYPDAYDLAKDLIGVLLPASYRSLYGFENRLRHACDELDCKDEGRILLSNEQVERFHELRLGGSLLPAFLSSVLAFDVAHPHHLLWHRVWAAPDGFEDYFKALTADEYDREALGQTREQFIHGFAGLSPDEKRDVEDVLRKLAHVWNTLQQQPPEPRRNFLPISLNLDARDKARPYWKGRLDDKEVEDWHIDLRAWVDDRQNVAREEMVAARKKAEAMLREKKIDSFPGGVDVFLKANLPFAVWLGWELRKVQDIRVLNEREARFTEFTGPGKELTLDGTSELRFFDKQDIPGKGPDTDAVLLVDVLNKSTTEQLDAFKDQVGNPVAYGHALRLIKRMKGEVLPEHTEPFLRDCVEILGQLKRQGVKHVHLGLAMPDTLAFLLGQQLHARVDRISLYEYRRAQAFYEYTFDLEDR